MSWLPSVLVQHQPSCVISHYIHIVYPGEINDSDSYSLHAWDQRQVLLWKSWTPYNQTVSFQLRDAWYEVQRRTDHPRMHQRLTGPLHYPYLAAVSNLFSSPHNVHSTIWSLEISFAHNCMHVMEMSLDSTIRWVSDGYPILHDPMLTKKLGWWVEFLAC